MGGYGASMADSVENKEILIDLAPASYSAAGQTHPTLPFAGHTSPFPANKAAAEVDYHNIANAIAAVYSDTPGHIDYSYHIWEIQCCIDPYYHVLRTDSILITYSCFDSISILTIEDGLSHF